VRPLVIGTRSSDLAHWQAQFVQRALRTALPNIETCLRNITKPGDQDRRAALHKLGETGAFTSTLEQALLDKEIDLAVHSLKDLPTQVADGLVIAAIPVRHDPADVLVAPPKRTLEQLPRGARVLTSSLRRRALVLHRRPDLRVHHVRGNVTTRLARLQAGAAEAMVLAAAGLLRLGMESFITERLDPAAFLPAPGQGALAVEIRADDKEQAPQMAKNDDPLVRAAVTAERALLAALKAGCHAPVGAYARFQEGSRLLTLTGGVLSLDGRQVVYRWDALECGGDASAAEILGTKVAQQLVAGGAAEILWTAEAVRENKSEIRNSKSEGNPKPK
jgi:hydroxymethylbilane synthase